MTRKGRRERVERSRWSDFRRVAENFLGAARIAREFRYFNAAGLLAIHAGIALADAVTVRRLGERSAGEDHHEAIALLQQAAPPGPASKGALGHFVRLIDEKNRLAHAGHVCREEDAARCLDHVERLAARAGANLDS